MVHSALLRRTATQRVGAWDEEIVGADHEYWLRAAALGSVFIYCPDSWSFQRRGGQQLSSHGVRMLQRSEATLAKGASYVKSEPHRSALLKRLARLHATAAWALPDLTRDERLARIAAARKTDPFAMGPAGYALLSFALWVPGMRSLLRRPALGAIRRAIASGIGLSR